MSMQESITVFSAPRFCLKASKNHHHEQSNGCYALVNYLELAMDGVNLGTAPQILSVSLSAYGGDYGL